MPPVDDRKWTWVSPENQPPALRSAKRRRRSVELLLAGLDRHPGPQRQVFEALRDVNEHLAARQPAFAAPVHVGVRDLAEPHVAADIGMPGAVVRVHVRVMAVRRERDSARRAEVDPTRDGPAGGVVDDRGSDPVPCLLDGLDPDARRRGAAVPHEIAPPHVGELAFPESDTEGGRRRGRDPHDGGRRPNVRRLSEAADVVGQELSADTAGRANG